MQPTQGLIAEVNRPKIRFARFGVKSRTAAQSQRPTKVVQPRPWGWTPPPIPGKTEELARPNYLLCRLEYTLRTYNSTSGCEDGTQGGRGISYPWSAIAYKQKIVEITHDEHVRKP